MEQDSLTAGGNDNIVGIRVRLQPRFNQILGDVDAEYIELEAMIRDDKNVTSTQEANRF